MSTSSLLQPQLAPRDAAGDLRRRVLAFLHEAKPAPGSRLATEAEFVRSLKISRSTVRRALDPLERDGWINRRAGAGTFVGARVRELLAVASAEKTGANGHGASPSASETPARTAREQGVCRIAVLIYNIGDLAHDWYTPGILQGLDEAGNDQRIVVELLGDRDGDVDALSRRIELSRPDVLICLSNRPQHAFVIRDAQRLGIHCLISGTPLAGLEVPGVCEDNRQAMSLAIAHLLERGHRRIGIALPRLAEPWVFERLDAYVSAMHSRGTSVHWTDVPSNDQSAGRLESFIREQALTALVPAHIDSMRSLDALVRAGRINVPGELSVVSFENDHLERRYLGIGDATRIRFPLRAMGQQLALLARRATEGEPVGSMQALPAELIEGKSVEALC